MNNCWENSLFVTRGMPVEDKGGVAGRDPREGEPVECQ